MNFGEFFGGKRPDESDDIDPKYKKAVDALASGNNLDRTNAGIKFVQNPLLPHPWLKLRVWEDGPLMSLDDIPNEIKKMISYKCNENGITSKEQIQKITTQVYIRPAIKILTVTSSLHVLTEGYMLEATGELGVGITEKSYVRYLICILQIPENNRKSLPEETIQRYKRDLAQLQMDDVGPLTLAEAHEEIEKVVDGVIDDRENWQ